MPPPPAITSVGQLTGLVQQKPFLVGLGGTPVRPWYLGQPSTGDALKPPFYNGAYDASLERDMLRDFRIRAAEFFPGASGVPDDAWLINAYQNGFPTRILEWSGSALVALFAAVESEAAGNTGRIWVLNPWELNKLSADTDLVPSTSGDMFKEKYVVNLNDPDAGPTPAAELPMAFKHYRNVRPQATRDIFITVHGNGQTPIEAIQFKFFARERAAYLQEIHIPGGAKKALKRELHFLGITRANLFPGAASVAQTVAYSYTNDFIFGAAGK